MEPFGYYLVEVKCYGTSDYLVADHHQPNTDVLKAAVQRAGENNEEDGKPGPVDGATIIGYVTTKHVVET